MNNLTTNQNTTLNLNQSYLVTLWMCGLGDGEVKNSSEFSNLDAVERSLIEEADEKIGTGLHY